MLAPAPIISCLDHSNSWLVALFSHSLICSPKWARGTLARCNVLVLLCSQWKHSSDFPFPLGLGQKSFLWLKELLGGNHLTTTAVSSYTTLSLAPCSSHTAFLFFHKSATQTPSTGYSFALSQFFPLVHSRSLCLVTIYISCRWHTTFYFCDLLLT